MAETPIWTRRPQYSWYAYATWHVIWRESHNSGDEISSRNTHFGRDGLGNQNRRGNTEWHAPDAVWMVRVCDLVCDIQ